MQISGPVNNVQQECEAILRSVPEWFGIEEALVEYAANSNALPTFVVSDGARTLGFVSLRQRFPESWEIDCIAIHAEARNNGYGKALLRHAERWLVERNALFLQVKTIAATSPNPHYAQTRAFYEHAGFLPLEVFPLLWAEHNPCLQMIKVLAAGTD